jgi:hypothetical protein
MSPRVVGCAPDHRVSGSYRLRATYDVSSPGRWL